MTTSVFRPAESQCSPGSRGLARWLKLGTRNCLSRASQIDVRQAILVAVVSLALLLMADPACAQVTGGGGDITTFLQNIVNIITGTAGKLIAVLAICFVGIGALMGALSLRAAGGVILGVMLIFSASWIVNQITGGI
jgi:type IV secretory pathway VirB2 component (pilin)